MSESTSKHHGGGKGSEETKIPEPSHAERAQTLMHLVGVGSLSTLSRKHSGWPFGSVMPYALDEGGSPIFLISTMAMHTQNILGDGRASLLVTQPDAEGDILGASRVTLMGEVSQVAEGDLEGIRQRYLDQHANAKYWVDFGDFAFYRMEVTDIYFVGGFGVMGWVVAADYYEAEADPLADVAPEVIEHMNEDHADALVLLAHAFAEVEADEAKMTAVDRLGFHLRLRKGDDMQGLRIDFGREVRNASQVREVLVEMVGQAREEKPKTQNPKSQK